MTYATVHKCQLQKTSASKRRCKQRSIPIHQAVGIPTWQRLDTFTGRTNSLLEPDSISEPKTTTGPEIDTDTQSEIESETESKTLQSSKKPCTLTSSTLADAADSTDRTRTTVGPGEKVLFKTNKRADWTASSGNPGSLSTVFGKRKFMWTAPSTPGTSTIKAAPRGRAASCSKVITTVAPQRIQFTKVSEDTFPAGHAAAGMKLDVKFFPESVSFQSLRWREVPGPANSITGSFTSFPAGGTCPHPSSGFKTLQHCPNPHHVAINHLNESNSRDHAFVDFGTGPWSAGSFKWAIPNKYKVLAETTEHPLPDTVQTFTLGSSGKVTVTKLSETVERTP